MITPLKWQVLTHDTSSEIMFMFMSIQWRPLASWRRNSPAPECLFTALTSHEHHGVSRHRPLIVRISGQQLGQISNTEYERSALLAPCDKTHRWPVCFPRLSHTWVRYPGFSGHGVKCPILITVVPGFSGDLIGCAIRSKWGPFGDLYLARKHLLCVWNKLFLGEIKVSQGRTRPVKSLWWQIVPMQESANEWKNLTFF